MKIQLEENDQELVCVCVYVCVCLKELTYGGKAEDTWCAEL